MALRFFGSPSKGDEGGFDQADRDHLMGLLVSMGALVRDNLEGVLNTFITSGASVAIPDDMPVDSMEVQVESECLRLIALRQPLREDLRFCFAVLRIAKDLERIGDEAQNVGEELSPFGSFKMPEEWEELPAMFSKCMEMLDEAMDCMVRLDPDLALSVFHKDDQVDLLWSRMRERAVGVFSGSCEVGRERAVKVLALLAVGRHLERIGDHCANVAELAYFVITGRRLRGESIP
ncbi:phosphate transport system regulatory protein PhoU [Thermanaerovibrio velox DSM 12556]|uniref:Phosphate-specific transport system accessory protein PhoU n=1 Tax=Thermanaerovibrio velox DSM 12556 TaxID=926567 RepID=H0UNQ7_9BACT|nr:phosphate signaling complex protein PhoU [Thermanaerovibrio velox]EHM10472.1 phosphate transport system regulatory protein PhoU [Thermanaerovibrio velox DSM 12556]